MEAASQEALLARHEIQATRTRCNGLQAALSDAERGAAALQDELRRCKGHPAALDALCAASLQTLLEVRARAQIFTL